MRFLAILALSALFVLPGCATDLGAEDDDHEDEPEAASSEALTSATDCKTTRMTAYDNGKPFPIEVIAIGKKRASKATGHAFLKMQAAAKAAGVTISLSSGFRSNDEQKRLYDCYRTRSCNNGNLAARPGYSNHQNGRALDIAGGAWVSKNARKFGFAATVKGEPWHYEFRGTDPGGPCSSTKTVAASDASDANETDDTDTKPPSASKTDAPCTSDDACNPGTEGSGLVCSDGRCVDGCRSSAHCPGSTLCVAGRCR